MFGIGGFELFLIVLFGFLVFGPDKLPEIAKTIGRAIAKFRDAQAEMSVTLKDVAFDKDAENPFKNPFEAADKMAQGAQRGAATAKDTAAAVKEAVAKAPIDDGEGTEPEPVRESFSERKARYERERKAKAEREAQDLATPAASEQEGGV